MKRITTKIFLAIQIVLCSVLSLKAQILKNDECATATKIAVVKGYCSNDAEYSNVNATPSGFGQPTEWGAAVGNDVWFTFVATAYDVNINVKGGGTSSGTLVNPLIAIYSGSCTGTINQEIGQNYFGATQSAYYKGALTVGETYLVRISAKGNATGTFQLCIDNFFPAAQPGQDCSNASLLCSKDRVSPINVTGAGLNNIESRGTCLDPTGFGSIEANTAWYKWNAANNGTLTFTITPTNTNDDIDWVLYDLGVAGACASVTAANAIRCASGSGVTCAPKYYLTGLNASSTDLNESPGCVTGQDGFVKFIDMQQGHYYALLINNFSSGNNGFVLEFGGTGEFAGPSPTFQTINTFCDNIFSTTYQADDIQAGYTYAWDFGANASTRTSNVSGPITINYTGPGERSVTLEVTSPLGCTTYQSFFFKDYGILPSPQIANAPTNYCVGDDLILTPLNLPTGVDAVWVLPDLTEIVSPTLQIPLTSITQSGTYSLKYVVDNCVSPADAININVLAKPVAVFALDPLVDQLFAAPITFTFINSSVDAVSYSWDFGDGGSSNLPNPTHTFALPGSYVVSLIAFNGNCTDTLSTRVIKILAEGDILVPNTFTPNNDGVNDYFNVLIANLKYYNIKIFNRYGSMLFTSDKILDSWDGKFKGEDMPVGVYYFIVDATDLAGNKLFRKNSVTLIR